MWQTVCKKIIAPVWVFLSILCLCSCGKSSSSEISEAAKLFERGILQENNITVSEIEYCEYSCSYFSISGLKDKKIEQQINDRIKALFLEMHECSYIPPYRGIKIKLSQFDSPQDVYTYTYALFNADGLLSVNSYATVFYANDTDSFSYSYNSSVTFDLSTGKELTLYDVVGGQDGLEAVNRAVDEYLLKKGFDSGYEDSIFGYVEPEAASMTAPFKGVKPEQKFYISSEGQLVLIMDWAAPEFLTEYAPYYITVDTGSLPVSSCNISTDIFDDAKPAYRLLDLYYKNYDNTRFASESIGQQPAAMDRLSVERYCSYNTELPQQIISAVHDLAMNDEYLPVNLREAYNDAAAEAFPQNWEAYARIQAYCSSRWGDYINLEQYFSFNAYNLEDYYSTLYSCDYSQGFCFRSDTAEPVSIRDLFIDGADIQRLLSDAIFTGTRRNDDVLSDENIRQLADMLAGHITGINVYSTYLMLYFDISNSELEKMIADYYVLSGSTADNSYFIANVMHNAAYRDIGCENLTIFN